MVGIDGHLKVVSGGRGYFYVTDFYLELSRGITIEIGTIRGRIGFENIMFSVVFVEFNGLENIYAEDI